MKTILIFQKNHLIIMGKTAILLIQIILCTCLIAGCSDSENNTDPEPEENTGSLEDLSEDMVFKEYISGIKTIYTNSTNLSRIQELFDKDTPLTDEELLELANNLGFDDVDSYFETFELLYQQWSNLAGRYQFDEEEISNVVRLYVDSFIGANVQNRNTSKFSQDHNKNYKNPDVCPPGNRECTCTQEFETCMAWCVDDTFLLLRMCGIDGSIICPLDREAHHRNTSLLIRCAGLRECCLIGFDSESCQDAFDPTSCLMM